jgi:RHS repeat-associated protein
VQRYGFNGQESDEEVWGYGNLLDMGGRFLDNRISRTLSIDPAFKEYATISPLSVFANNPIYYVDPDGRRIRPVGGEAINAMRALFRSFGNSESIRKTMGVEIDDGTGAYYSNKDLTERNLNKELKKIGVSKTDRKVAYQVYLAIRSNKEIQVEIYSAGTGGDNTRGDGGGQPGSVVGGDALRINDHTGLDSFRKMFASDMYSQTELIQEAVRPSGGEYSGAFKPDNVEQNYAFYKARGEQMRGIVGTILIDGTGTSPAQEAEVLKEAIVKENPTQLK